MAAHWVVSASPRGPKAASLQGVGNMDPHLVDRLRSAIVGIVDVRPPLGIHQTLHQGAVLLVQHEVAQYVFMLTKGIAKQSICDADGREIAASARLAWSTLGLWAGLLAEPQPHTIEAVTKCEVHVIASRVLRERVAVDPHVCRAVLVLQSLEALDMEMRAVESEHSARNRVERVIAALALETGTNESSGWVRFAVPGSHRSLAALAGVAPETLSRTLSRLEAEALLERGRGWLRLRRAQRRPTAGVQGPSQADAQ
jgi:CRP/FNR family transcriptional regulator, cyclic AMP receptor protein